MELLFLEYHKIFYAAWIVSLFMHIHYNSDVYDRMEHEDYKHRPSSFWRWSFNGTATMLVVFTFWWKNYKTEEDMELRRSMKLSNRMSIIFVIYSVITFIIFLYVYDQPQIHRY